MTSHSKEKAAPGILIAVEGIDGCGKSTAVEHLAAMLERDGRDVTRFSFPDYDEPIAGDKIARFLRGGLGYSRLTPPELLALLFALNRAAKREEIEASLDRGHAVLCDRYVYSNAAFQGAKLRDAGSLNDFLAWVELVEFGVNAVPRPSMSILVDLPPSALPARGADREERAYLRGAQDVHEMDYDLQVRVAAIYKHLVASRDDFERVDAHPGGRRATPQELADEMMRLVEPGRVAA